MATLPKIAITMGDPAGIGPEVCLRLMADAEVRQTCTPMVYGDEGLLRRVANACELAMPQERSAIRHLEGLDAAAIEPGTVSAAAGQASFDFIEAAIADAIAGRVDAVVTGPINKEAWHAAGIKFPGHTELFADRYGTDDFCMMMAAPSFSCSLVTTHIGYSSVTDALSSESILKVARLSHEALQRIHGRAVKLVMLGLNPHAGEHGLFGDREEERIIQPAVDAALAAGIDIEGPIPPDTGFLPWRREQTDGYICMYHDQGLIPFKALNFDTGVNVTLGLPIVRTSVDHGTAFDIAWQGTADPSSLKSAVNLAVKLSQP